MAEAATTTGKDEPDALEELLEFLSDTRLQVRKQAVDIVKGLSGSDEGVLQLARRAAAFVPLLLRLLSKTVEESSAAATALVNMCQDAAAAAVALDKGGIERVMERVMLLANLSQTERGAKLLLQEGRGELEGFHLRFLLKLGESAPESVPHAATVAANATAHELGRRLVASGSVGEVPALMRLLAAASVDARRGAAGALRNCCADPDVHEGLLGSGPGLVQALLRPIRGAAPLEADAEVRQAAAEAVAGLARTEAGRAALWAAEAPDALKKGYESEEAPGVCAAMEETITQLMTGGQREGGGDAGGDDDGDEPVGIIKIAG